MLSLLFLFQNVLDIEYLWSGAALPSGMTYAEYAHRGAYPLIATTLLAGLLTLITFGRQCTGPVWKQARILVYIWLVQNVFLVASSLLRLWKYISVYSLTELRVAAAFWMLLVACGLCLILYKVWKNKDLAWLVWSEGSEGSGWSGWSGWSSARVWRKVDTISIRAWQSWRSVSAVGSRWDPNS